MGTRQEFSHGNSVGRYVTQAQVFLSLSQLIFSLAPVTALAADDQAQDTGADAAAGVDTGDSEGPIEEVTVVGSQIKGAAISDALSVSIIDAGDIESLGIGSGDELLEYMPEQGQNFFNEAAQFSGGVNSARGDIGTFNLRNMGTGNTLVLLNGRRLVNSAGYQTEEIGGSFVPVNSVNANAIPVFGVQQVEVLRDGASAIYGADAVAGVVNTTLKKDFEGLTVRVRYDDYDNIPRNDARLNIEWGRFFNNGRTNIGVFFDYYDRDNVNTQDDPKWNDPDYRRFLVGTPWEGDLSFRNDSSNSLWGQFDANSSASRSGIRHLTDGSGQYETYPLGDSRCEGGFIINDVTCGNADGQGTYRYNWSENRDLFGELERYNLFAYINHEFDNGVESFTELSWYEADTFTIGHPSSPTTGVADLLVPAESYYNPFGVCGNPNRLPDELIPDVSCDGVDFHIDNYRFAEVPRFIDTNNHTYRILQGFRGSWGKWDWETALTLSEAERDNVTHNRVSNTLMEEALADPTPSAYNPWIGGDLEGLQRALVDVYRNNSSDLKMVDFKMSNPELFNMPAGPVGFLAGFEYREESFKDNRDPRLDGTITYTTWNNQTYPIISDVANSSPTADSRGERDVTSVFTEFAIPLHDTLDLQLALRYEDFSDVESTTVGKAAFGWRPWQPLLFRGSWSEAFRAPNLITVNEELVVRNNGRDDYVCLYVEDQQDVNLDCNNSVQRRARGSKELVPEESTNTSLGIVWDATDNLTVTLDYWSIEKDDSIGLFGEENHTIYDLLLRVEAGASNCAGASFNPAIGRFEADEDEVQLYLDSGICPAGVIDFVEDKYTNLDTRTIEGHDIGVYYDKDTSFGDFRFKWVGTYYDKFEQEAGGLALEVIEGIENGTLPSNTPILGFADLLGRDGNVEQKHNASVRWSKDAWDASLTMLYIDDFYDSDETLSDGTRFVLDSMTTWNTTASYNFNLFNTDSRVRIGVNNLTDERAPLCDCRFGYWDDVHRDTGRYWYVDLRMQFD
jgi:outer membrane receptor protein involved in Fe transport